MRHTQRLIMRFPHPGRVPGTQRRVRWFFAGMHGLCALSILYPYVGPVINLMPMALLLVVIRRRLPPEAVIPYRFLLQRLALQGVVTAALWLVLFRLGFHGWPALYFSLMPLHLADAVSAFRGGVGLFYGRKRDANL